MSKTKKSQPAKNKTNRKENLNSKKSPARLRKKAPVPGHLPLIQSEEASVDLWDSYIAWILLATLALLPVIIHAKTGFFVSPSLTSGVTTGVKAELYNNYKAVLLLFSATIIMALLGIKILTGKYTLRPSVFNPILLMLILCLLLSLSATEFKSIALYGSFYRREGTITFLSYLAIFFAATQISYSTVFYRLLKLALGVVIGINLIFALSNFVGYNWFENPIFRQFILSSTTTSDFNATGMFRSTLYNPNYVSGLFAALASFFAILACHEVGVAKRLASLILCIASFIIMLSALSSSGFIAILLASPFLVLLALYKVLRQNPARAALTFGIVILAMGLCFVLLNSYEPRIINEAVNNPREEIQKTREYLKQKPVSSPASVLALPQPGEAPLSGRFYIWKKTLQLINERPLTGYGLDTLGYYFPHNDPQKRAQLMTYEQQVDKPHCFYLEVAFGAGILSLLFLIALLVLILEQNRKTLVLASQSQEPGATSLPAAFLAFALVYLLQWIVNDSSLGGSVIFWTLAGIACGLSVDWSGSWSPRSHSNQNLTIKVKS